MARSEQDWVEAFARSTQLSRRRFSSSGLVAGFTLCTGPLNAATIVTDTNGLDAAEVKIPTADVTIPAYRARPKGKSNLPLVLVVQEVFGIHEHIRDICRRFANLGYYAIAPSLYARYGDPGKYDMSTAQQLVKDIVSKVPDREVMSDLDAAVNFAGKDGADAKRLGITGFCWGGRIVWLYSAHNPQVKAGVAWYGQLRSPQPPDARRPKYPLDLVGDMHAPVLGLYGGKDKGISQADVAAMNAALQKAGKESKLEIFADAEHGFFADYRPSYNAMDAQQGWRELLAWFRKYGVA
ncbi:MAG: dienelactone hydrolase family protein [Alphaproteobacteria bacterium]|nr:dienelactone hydrolase family protein [Alphaproteobacteria bacterium]